MRTEKHIDKSSSIRETVAMIPRTQMQIIHALMPFTHSRLEHVGGVPLEELLALIFGGASTFGLTFSFLHFKGNEILNKFSKKKDNKKSDK